jgi:hypothetical protein
MARQALLNCPAWHRIPLHFRDSASLSSTASQSRPRSIAPTVALAPAAAEPGLNSSTHAPEVPYATKPRTPPPGEEPLAEATNRESLADYVQPKPKRGRPKGSKNKPKEGIVPLLEHTDNALFTNQGRTTRSSQRQQQRQQYQHQQRLSNDGFATTEAADVMDEQLDEAFWSQLPPFQNDLRKDEDYGSSSSSDSDEGSEDETYARGERERKHD